MILYEFLHTDPKVLVKIVGMLYAAHLLPITFMVLGKWLLSKGMGFGRAQRVKMIWFPLVWPCIYFLIPSKFLGDGLLLVLEYLFLRFLIAPEDRTRAHRYFLISTGVSALIFLLYLGLLILAALVLLSQYE